MGPSPCRRRVSAMVLGAIYLLVICLCCAVSRAQEDSGNAGNQQESDVNRDLQALLRVKESLVDTSGVLGSWDPSSSTPCNWTGVICRARDFDSTQPVVVSLVLRNCNLSGTISPGVGQLTHLETLHLGNNFLTGPIPPDLGNLSALRLLDVSYNSLTGSIPSTLGRLGRLEEAIFDENDLTGAIPSSVENLVSCAYFSVQGNRGIGGLVPAGLKIVRELNLQNTQLRGPLAEDFYDINLVTFLNLNNLDFSGSKEPDLRRLPNLRGLYMRNTSLTKGPIPSGLASASSLEELDLSQNSFVDEIPQWIANLPNLKVLLLSSNALSGPMPELLGQNSELSVLDVSQNSLNGTVPQGLCNGGSLETLNLSGNRLEGYFPPRLENCTSLIRVSLGRNLLSGSLPAGLGRSASNLSTLDLARNAFGGSIPGEFGMLQKLLVLDLSDNRLSGTIPPQLGNLLRLQTLDLSSNMLKGSLPPELANCKSLETLLLQGNLLDGPAPVKTLSGLVQLERLNLAENRMQGRVEPGIESLTLLKSLNFSRNSLNGSIPSDWGSVQYLETLDLSRNQFSGGIPDSFSGLLFLQAIDLSFNQLGGTIPSSLLNLESLRSLNLSYNMLSGTVPEGRQEWPTSSFIGNEKLCVIDCLAAASATPAPLANAGRGEGGGGLSKGAVAGAVVGSIAGAALLAGLIIALCMHCCTAQTALLGRAQSIRRKTPAVKPFLLPEIFKGFSYPDIMEATRNLSEDNVIGRGGYGTVYRGDFPAGMTCAVKQMVLEQESSRSSFQNHLREVEIAGQTRHKNIVSLVGFCQKGDETLIVYEYMPNGSLGDALHRRGRRGTYDQGATIATGKGDKLNWRTRFNILCGAAGGLEYMHNECRPQVLHRDIKSNNILLDADMDARITDFGMAKMVENAGVSIPNMALVTGSAGYLAPEYYRNMRITDKSDVYSFGVVILETLTGMYPTENATVSDDFSLVEYVITTLRQEGVLEAILDTALQEEVIESQDVEEQMTLVLQIGLLSTVEDPPQRPSMREVVEMLDYSKGEHGKVRVPDLGDLLQDLAASPAMSPSHS
ncbi:hypothetical protein MPTK1_1g19400 [Marchantia polymorpha subsp. ruderalis]|uniref:Protein kinase domain-containing protein n=2 Tax=Marchantia polymorpha TaxID=3197 RepID=A0AAF6ARW1_MARPO|nr:hypothetical protein MARPO_0001s0279 [Marchantia polymorpha]BBM99181.1 hypothetical protein Mp_1g19400 [Marchantia polymorpha subsp. ruderalis]|eukprot:PTQ50259.1 hypothetical protein MARPO_0001s0279 [Marchantia polymorpha]